MLPSQKVANMKSNMWQQQRRSTRRLPHEIVIAASGHVDDDDARTHVPIQTQLKIQLQQQLKIQIQLQIYTATDTKIQMGVRVTSRVTIWAWNTCKAAGDLHDFCDEAESKSKMWTWSWESGAGAGVWAEAGHGTEAGCGV